METITTQGILLADAVWIATALLHKEHPEREEFSKDEIKKRFIEEGLWPGRHSNSLMAHINQHCVANKPRSRKTGDSSKLQGGAYRLLYKTRTGYRRLYRPGDDVNPDRIQPRKPSKDLPRKEDLPTQYQSLIDWYKEWAGESPPSQTPSNYENDPLIRLIGSGKHIWADEHADEYVNRLREDLA